MCAQETVLLGTHNICLSRELRKLFLLRTLKGLIILIVSFRIARWFKDMDIQLVPPCFYGDLLPTPYHASNLST